MALGDLPPRQKMINLMYLVLLCLLAMNVSKEILHSFLIINEGLERTTKNYENKIQQTYERFKRMNVDDAKRVGEKYKNAQQVKIQADEIDNYIDVLKRELYRVADGIEDDAVLDSMKLTGLVNNDDQDVGAQVLIGSDETKPKGVEEAYSALKLKKMLTDFNNTLVEVIHNEMLLPELIIPLESQQVNDVEETWEIANFYHLPMAATITNLSRFQAAVRNSEADALKELMRELGEEDFSFDTVSVKVIPKKGTYIALGDSFQADVIVAAYSTTKDPVMRIGRVDSTQGGLNLIEGGETKDVTIENGIATYGIKTSKLGKQSWGGVIEIMKPNGKWAKYPFSHDYMVAQPSLVVSPTKMNVLYKGLKNPVNISVPGMASENLEVSVAGGDCRIVKLAPGEYELIPSERNRDNELILNVRSNDENAQPLEPFKFRLKRVPKPMPYFRKKTGSVSMTPAQIRSGRFINVELKGFVFDLNYEVVSFSMSAANASGRSTNYTSNSGELTNEMKQTIRSMRPGQKVTFYNIVAKIKGPQTSPIPLDGIIVIKVR